MTIASQPALQDGHFAVATPAVAALLTTTFMTVLCSATCACLAPRKLVLTPERLPLTPKRPALLPKQLTAAMCMRLRLALRLHQTPATPPSGSKQEDHLTVVWLSLQRARVLPLGSALATNHLVLSHVMQLIQGRMRPIARSTSSESKLVSAAGASFQDISRPSPEGVGSPAGGSWPQHPEGPRSTCGSSPSEASRQHQAQG